MRKSRVRCLILGGCGFLGSHAVEALLNAGYSVRVFDRPNMDTANIDSFIDDIELFSGDLSNITDIDKATDHVDYVFHFIGTTIPKTASDNPIYDLESNVLASINFLEASKNKKIRKIIFSSSGGTVYGLPHALPIHEDHRTDPISAYGISKLTVEKYIKYYSYQYGLNHIILRFSNPYGPRQNIGNYQGAIIHFLDSIYHSKKIEIWGDGSVVRDYFFVRDLIPLFQTLPSADLHNETFNIGYGKGTSINEVLKTIKSVVGADPDITYTKGRTIDVNINYLCIDKAKQRLNWDPKTSLAEGIRETWLWLKSESKNVHGKE
jgi:UDP-glucose 4-epimerase